MQAGQRGRHLSRRRCSSLSHAVLQLLLWHCQAAQPADDASSAPPRRPVCEKPPYFDMGRLHRAGPEWKDRCPLLSNVCFDQGSFIIYDQGIMQGSPAGELLPNFNNAQWELPYFHRHHDINPQGSSTPEMTVNGVSMPYLRVGGWVGEGVGGGARFLSCHVTIPLPHPPIRPPTHPPATTIFTTSLPPPQPYLHVSCSPRCAYPQRWSGSSGTTSISAAAPPPWSYTPHGHTTSWSSL